MTGVVVFFALLIGIPTAFYLYEPATCTDGIANQGETDIDKGGPCQILDARYLIPDSVLWTRTFKVRDGLFNGVVYIENPNGNAGVKEAPYRFQIYDDRGVIVAERTGVTYLSPGMVTPIFIGGIETGNRDATRAFFEFVAPLVWERLADRSGEVIVRNKDIVDIATQPRITATIEHTGVKDLTDLTVVAVVYDIAGNAFAASSTIIPLLPGGDEYDVFFVWPEPFAREPARIDVLPSVPPVL